MRAKGQPGTKDERLEAGAREGGKERERWRDESAGLKSQG